MVLGLMVQGLEVGVEDLGCKSCGLWIVGCGLWVVGCGLWVVGCRLGLSCRLEVRVKLWVGG